MRSPRKLIAAGATAALLALPSVALAAERPDHAGRDSRATATEDDDSNDRDTPNNVADAGDDAHPSGKDRSVERGRSGNQGKAQRDPDDDGRGPDRTNGGMDQADGPGGVDKADQDGNNGCGNDDDFEDDNEGHCLGRDADRPSRSATGGGSTDRRDDRPATKSSMRTAKQPATRRGTRAPAGSDAQGHTAGTTVTGSCPATSVTVTSTKDLSNVVLVFADGDHQRFEGLSGRSGVFAGTGEHAGETIVRVHVKSGANASGDGPGYGERRDLAGCAGASTAVPSTSTTGGTGAVGSGRDGERPSPGRPAPSGSPAAPAPAGPAPVGGGVLGVVLERPAAPTSALPSAAGEVAAAGLGVQSAAAPATATAPSGTLPRSGSDAVPAAVAAALALLAGTVAIRRTRAS